MQEDGYFLKFIICLTVLLYILFQVKTKNQQQERSEDHFFDFYNCIGYVAYLIIYGFFVLYNPSTVASLPTRMFLQITFVDIFLIRLIWKCHRLRDRLKMWMFRFTSPQAFDVIH